MGAKGIEIALEAANTLKLPLKIVGETAGLKWEEAKLKRLSGETVEYLGRLPDEELWRIYAGAKGFLALAEDEDFGMTLVEAQAAGTPVIAYYGGGYKETVLEGKTGEFYRQYTVDSLAKTIQRFERKTYRKSELQKHAAKFSEQQFIKGIENAIPKKYYH